MEIDNETIHSDMLKIKKELDLIKNILISEGELTDWAKTELEKARLESEGEYTDLEDL